MGPPPPRRAVPCADNLVTPHHHPVSCRLHHRLRTLQAASCNLTHPQSIRHAGRTTKNTRFRSAQEFVP